MPIKDLSCALERDTRLESDATVSSRLWRQLSYQGLFSYIVQNSSTFSTHSFCQVVKKAQICCFTLRNPPPVTATSQFLKNVITDLISLVVSSNSAHRHQSKFSPNT